MTGIDLRLARTVLAPVVLGLAALVLWQAIVVGADVKPYVIPAPLDIWKAFTSSFDSVLTGSLQTGRNALIGLAVGTVVGVAAAVVSSSSRTIDQMSAPVVAALSVVPIVALAPVLYTMYGAAADTGRQVVAALAVFVPVYVNTLRGLRQVLPVHRDLMRTGAASSWQTARMVTVPTAMPHLFTGLRIGSSLTVISALVAEYFGGPVSGLGKAITSSAASSNYTQAWAYVLGSILLGLTFYLVTLGVEVWFTRHGPTT